MNYSNNIHRKALSKSIGHDKLAHAYIIYGGDEKNRSLYIKETIKEIFCTDNQKIPCGKCTNCRKVENGNMEDLITIDKEDTSIKVEQIRALIVSLSNKPFTRRTVALINNADLMTPESQNKLLKSLEEPASGTVIILNASNLFGLFPTIRSRCVTVRLEDSGEDVDTELDERAANIVKYSMVNKPLHSIFNEVSECVSNYEDAERLLDTMEKFVRDMIVYRYEPGMVKYEPHREKACRINWDQGYHFYEYLEHIEVARANLKRKLNWKYIIKDLIINFKQEERHG